MATPSSWLDASRTHTFPDLVRLCSESTQPVTLDLTELQSADRIAVDALRRLRHDGITFIGIPTYLQFSLDDLD